MTAISPNPNTSSSIKGTLYLHICLLLYTRGTIFFTKIMIWVNKEVLAISHNILLVDNDNKKKKIKLFRVS